MQHEIVSLRCPSCGAGVSTPSRGMPFGAEFSCESCGVTSVLIINRELLPLGTLQEHGDKVCFTCGRVAARAARFCQEGHSLVRKCLACHKEFPVHHQRCDFCGRLQLDVQIEREMREVEKLENEVEYLERHELEFQSRYNKADLIPVDQLEALNGRYQRLRGRNDPSSDGPLPTVAGVLIVIMGLVYIFSQDGLGNIVKAVGHYLIFVFVLGLVMLGAGFLYERSQENREKEIEGRLLRHRTAVECEQKLPDLRESLSAARKALSEARARLSATKDKG